MIGAASVPFALLLLGADLSRSAPAADGGGAGVGELTQDPVVRELVASALVRRPELAAARAQIAAERERVEQSRTLADPTLALGIQNDGFGGIQVGKMPMSWVSIVASQTLPWPGKRGLRGEVAAFDARGGELELRRALLGVVADVERAYVDLLLLRGQLGVLARLQSLWQQAASAARARYEAGEGTQSDLLRAQLEQSRLARQRWALVADEHRRVMVLNRLAGRPLVAPLPTERALTELSDPADADSERAVATAVAESPELAQARLAGEQADRRIELAKQERWPDVTLSAGVMPRGGGFETMWQAGVALNIPVWSMTRQGRVMAENRARGQAARSSADGLRQLIEQRVRERGEALHALLEMNRLYRTGLLVQSEAAATSALVQYQVGRLTFASVLEALSAHLADVNGYLESLAAAQRLAVANRELSLEGPERAGATGVTAAGPPTASPGAMGRQATELPDATGSNASMSRM
jgi:outer membrane protein, heavy metal efflux system